MSTTLYVFLHGTICLVEFEKYFRGIFIGMEEHRVAAGNFLTERTVPKGTFLHLNNVPAGSDTLDHTKNIVVDVEKLDEIAIDLYRHAEIILPRPVKLHSLRTGNLRRGDLAGLQHGQVVSYFSDLQVFEYTIPNHPEKVELAGNGFVSWFFSQPDFPAGGKPANQYCSLHLFSEPETAPNDDRHFTEEFNRGCRILGSEMRLNSPLPVPPLASGSLPPGVLEEETLSLEQRVHPVTNLLAKIPHAGQIVIAGDSHYCGTAVGTTLISRSAK